MSFYDAIRVGASGAADTAFTVDRSLRFNDNDSAYLQRTPSSASNRNTFTFSFWVKRANLGMYTHIFGMQYSSSANQFVIRFDNDDKLTVFDFQTPLGGMQMRKTSTAVFRDVSAWYHIVAAIDTTQSTGSNRNRIYVNNNELTSFDNDTTPSQNHDTIVNTTNTHYIGQKNSSNYFDGYLAEFNFIDGQQLTPASFGETNATTGQWIPKNTSELTYGTNGYRLQFLDNSGTTATTLGKDTSGNSNNFTPNNFSVSAGAGNDSLEDTPTNNWCNWNVLSKDGGTTLSNGNLNISSANYGNNTATFFVTSGKWYWEGVGTGYVGAICGIDGQNFATSLSSSGSNSIGYWSGNGYAYWGGGSTGSGTTYSSSDVIGIALDMDNGTVKFYKNNTLIHNLTFGSGTIPDLSAGVFPVYNNGTIGTTFTAVHNFGQRAFSYTPPTGYKALNSQNLPDPTILLGNKHFDTLLYSGTGSSQNITGLEYQPDWVWIKSRSSTNFHNVYDTLRLFSDGTKERIYPNETNAGESSTYSGTTNLTAFNSNGFTVSDGADTNDNGQTFVAWNWNAGETDSATYRVVVVSDSGNKYRFRNSANSATFAQSAVTLDLAEGGTYIFNMDDSTNASHPFSIGTAANGTVYTSGITYFLDGVSKTYSEYTSGFASATTRRLHITVPASAPQLYYWCSAHSGMGGAINTNSTLGSSNFDGDLQSTTKVNATAGFSIVKWTSGASTYKTVGHGLGVKPDIVIVKSRSVATGWFVFYDFVDGTNDYLQLNSTASSLDAETYSIVPPTSTVFGTEAAFVSNLTNATMIAYVFSSVAGYSKFGKYTGNGSSDGTFVFTNFRPSWVLIKSTSGSTHWVMKDTARNTYNVANKTLLSNSSTSEDTSSSFSIDFLSNGFKCRASGTHVNGSGGTYVYFAFAESPFKNSRAR